MSSVTIGFPCWNRAEYLQRTLESIRRQNFNEPLELIVAESGDDGKTKIIAEKYGCRYFSMPREEYPEFQSVSKMWNALINQANNEVLILQCAECVHESDNLIEELVKTVESGPKICTTALLRDLDSQGQFRGWYNHPKEGSRPGWISGSGPIAIKTADVRNMGGFEELFYGYGHEDDYFYFLLGKNGFHVGYTIGAVCGHLDHPRTAYERVTGFANRALIRILTHEVNAGLRPPHANIRRLDTVQPVNQRRIMRDLTEAIDLGASREFTAWVNDFFNGDKSPENAFQAHRNAANEGRGLISHICEMAAEAVWARLIRDEDIAASKVNTHGGAWLARIYRAADIMEVWTSTAADYGAQLKLEFEAKNA